MIFKPIKEEDIKLIAPYFRKENYSICDFTVGGLFMWVNYFDYDYCIQNEILYIRGRDVTDFNKIAFLYPLNQNNEMNGITALLDYQFKNGSSSLILNSVTEDLIKKLEDKFAINKELIIDWSDYIYDAKELALLKGRKFHSKRNFVNQFINSYPDYQFTIINKDNISIIRSAFIEWVKNKDELSDLERYESIEVLKVLKTYNDYPFSGTVLFYKNEVCAFTIGEIIGDTCFIHIEKANTSYKGVYQMINQLYANFLFQDHNIKYLNREEDVGIPGLRKAKQSYYPIYMKKKYRVVIENGNKKDY